MDCRKDREFEEEFASRFKRRVVKDRVPLCGSIDLCTRCNFNCVHCYLPQERRKGPWKERECSTEEILGWVDAMADGGCLYLLITGGEPLLRQDFADVYTHARKRGMIVTVFTNGSLVTDDHVRLFKTYPPAAVEISVYAASSGIYHEITGVQDALPMVVEGIHRLKDNGIRIKLKTVLMDLNRHELQAVENIARELGADFRFDAAILPRLDGDMSPLGHRISPEEAVELEFRDSVKAEEWRRLWEKSDKATLGSGVYGCGAGQTSFHITTDGFLQPCLMSDILRYDLRKGDFHEGWTRGIAGISQFSAGPENICRDCELINLCGYCPPFFKLENGSEQIRSEYICRMGHLRNEKIMDLGGI